MNNQREIELRKVRLMFPKGINISRVGLEIGTDLSFEEWEHLGRFLNGMHKSILWFIGDWLNFGELKYGETYAQAIDVTGHTVDTLRNAKWVASRVEVSRRRDGLSFSHHQEVAPLEPAEQNEWLDKAVANDWRSRELREQIKAAKNEDSLLAERQTNTETTMISEILAEAIEEIRSVEKDMPEVYGRWKQEIDNLIGLMENLHVKLDEAEKD